MKKAWICLLLTAALVIFGQRQVRNSIVEYTVHTLGFGLLQQEEAPQAAEPLFDAPKSAAADSVDVTLYYRFADTSVLGAERAHLTVGREENVAWEIVRRLVAGPDAAHGRLSGVFPSGTQAYAVAQEDATVYVTLSREFLGKPDGAPADWEDLAVWQQEATLRRWLAAQSIVCALTENGRCQRVQLYVADEAGGVPVRIPLAYFDLSVMDASVVLAASSREEAAILTAQRAMQMILDGWQQRDWETVYALLCADEGAQMPTLTAFEAQMADMDVTLLTAEVSTGTVDVSGQKATLMLDGAARSPEQGDLRMIRRAVPLERIADNWAMRMGTLLSLMGAE